MQKMWVRSLGWEDSLEKEIATQYLCLENPMDRRAWKATVHVAARVDHNLATTPPPPPKAALKWPTQPGKMIQTPAKSQHRCHSLSSL